MDHPPVYHLELLLRGDLSHEDTLVVVPHLLRCPRCAALLFARRERPAEDPFLSAPVAIDLDDTPPTVLWFELHDLAPNHRRLAVQKRRYRKPFFALWLIRHSRYLAPFRPEEALLAAELALLILDQLAFHGALPDGLLHLLRASALAHVGNARRCLGLFADSFAAFQDAERELASADAGPIDHTDFLSLRASLYKDLGRFDEATADLRAAFRLSRHLLDPHHRGRLLLKLADVVGLAKPAAGLGLLLAAEKDLDFRAEPRLELALLHRRAWFLDDTGKPEAALEVFRAAWPVYNRWPDGHVRGLRAWLWGRLERSLGEYELAAKYISRAVAVFREIGAAHDHAVSGLDLADVYLRLGQPEAARMLLAESVSFLEEHLHPQGLSRWLALVKDRLTPELLSEAARYFTRHWYVPREPAA